MQLPQHIIDLVGSLYDEGESDDEICLAVLKVWSEDNARAYADNPETNTK